MFHNRAFEAFNTVANRIRWWFKITLWFFASLSFNCVLRCCTVHTVHTRRTIKGIFESNTRSEKINENQIQIQIRAVSSFWHNSNEKVKIKTAEEDEKQEREKKNQKQYPYALKWKLLFSVVMLIFLCSF